jgi:hypothetical protein
MAEIEIGVLSNQCLNRRIADPKTLALQTSAWQDRRNRDGIPVKWRFTVQNARTAPPHLYLQLPYWSCTSFLMMYWPAGFEKLFAEREALGSRYGVGYNQTGGRNEPTNPEYWAAAAAIPRKDGVINRYTDTTKAQ